MGVPIFGLNIPAPKVRISKDKLEKYADLYRGIRDRKDTVSWRTLIVSIRELLGESSPDFRKIGRRYRVKGRKLISQLVSKTYLSELVPEIEYAVGIRSTVGRGGKNIDILLLNGRHSPEPLLWKLADYAKSQGKNVAVINPVGHYNDGQTRVLAPFTYFRKINKLVIISSTQSKLRGSITVLSNVIKLLRSNDLARKVGSVDVIIPMFGGSRGHRFGQSQEVGYEVMEAGFNAQMLSLITRDVLTRLEKEIGKAPVVRFSSIDIHNNEYPEKTFAEYGFTFSSISPSACMAKAIVKLVKLRRTSVPLKLVACDTGAVPRTQELAGEILTGSGSFFKELQVIYIQKKRVSAGIVSNAQFERIEIWKKVGSKIQIGRVKVPTKPVFKNAIIVYSDDMIDTGGTAERDLNFIAGFYPGSDMKIFIATHPVFSKGFGAIKRIGADVYILGNTLNWEDLDDIKGVEVVDFAETLYSFIQKR
jgi:phosphoribosylpyrophosphate synthetase